MVMALDLLTHRRGARTLTRVRNPRRMAFGPMDHEIHGSAMVYQLGSIGIRAELDAGTGEFGAVATIFDTEVAALGLSQNGPEFGATAAGDRIYYCRADSGGWLQVWRATVSGGSVTTQQITTSPQHKVNILPSTDTSRASTLIAYIAGGYVRVIDETQPDVVHNVTIALGNDTASMRWSGSTSRLLACKGEAPDRGAIIEWSPGGVRTCTPGATDILYDPYGFYCPELSGEAAVVTVGPGFAGTSLRIFRTHPTNNWQAVHEIPFPQQAKSFGQNFMYSVEPVFFAGKTYFLLTLTDRVGWITTDATCAQVWVCTFGGEWTRVDAGGTNAKHHEMESYLSSTDKFFVYWNEITPQGVWLWRAEVVDAA